MTVIVKSYYELNISCNIRHLNFIIQFYKVNFKNPDRINTGLVGEKPRKCGAEALSLSELPTQNHQSTPPHRNPTAP